MKKIFFSLVIPTLNEERYLPKLLKDVTNQTFKSFEVIVVDGYSEDKTTDKALSYKDQINITVIESKKRNVSQQRNLGAKNSAGDWIIFVDSDSRLPKVFLQKLHDGVKKLNPGIFSCWCNPDSKSEADHAVANFINITFDFMRVLRYPTALGALIGVKKKVFLKTKGFDEEMIYAEDGKFVRDCVATGATFKFFKEPEFTYSFRRWKKDGTLEVLRKHILLHARRLTKLQITKYLHYEMGGDRYD